MGIDKIGSVNNYNDYSKINKTSKSGKVAGTDSLSISNEGANISETKRILSMVMEAPDVRADRVAEVKEKLKNPDYINSMVLDKVADRIINPFEE